MRTVFQNVYAGKTVLVTGHTGFKGSWLCLWLQALGARVVGYALPPEEKSLFLSASLESEIAESCFADISDRERLLAFYQQVNPDFVFHLAAQPLVRLSYSSPVETFQTNVMGTVHLLECLRLVSKPTVAVLITTDKCYANQEWLYAYRECEAMGGHDPYSASKGAMELVVQSYRNSYFSGKGSLVKVVPARAGNVIGGGDWAVDRIIPDCIRALDSGQKIPVRNRIATRPWQHVLEPLSGYLQLGQVLAMGGDLRASLADYMTGFNFGPSLQSNRTVEELVKELLKYYEGQWVDASDPQAVHEASKLNLAIDKAYHLLGWEPVWDFERTVQKTVAWYRSSEALPFTINQILEYVCDARNKGVIWAQN